MALALWIDFFEDLQHVRGRSRNTVLAYRRDLEMYDEFLKLNKDISYIYEFMKSKNLSPRSQARIISSLRTYFKFCEKAGKKVPVLDRLKQPKVNVKLPKAISVSDFGKLYRACQVADVYKSARNQITLLMLFGLGCRVTELITLDLQDFNETDQWLRVEGKGGKERLVPLTDNLLLELKQYFLKVRPHLTKDQNNHSVLINDRGKRPSRVDIWRWLSAWSEKAGFKEPVSPHKFRHGCATALLESGADLRSIQMLLGHSSIQTTQIYTSVQTSHLRREVDQHHPLSKKQS